MDVQIANPLVSELVTDFVGKKKYREADGSVWFIKNLFFKASPVYLKLITRLTL